MAKLKMNMPKDESASRSYQTLIFGVLVSFNNYYFRKKFPCSICWAPNFFMLQQKIVMITSVTHQVNNKRRLIFVRLTDTERSV